MSRGTQPIGAGNIFDPLPKPAAAEDFRTLATVGKTRVERIVSHGHTTPGGEWYDQGWDEWVLVLSGAARLRIEGEARDRNLGEGGWMLLPKHTRHRVTWTTPDRPTVWLAVHVGEPKDG